MAAATTEVAPTLASVPSASPVPAAAWRLAGCVSWAVAVMAVPVAVAASRSGAMLGAAATAAPVAVATCAVALTIDAVEAVAS